MNINNISTGKQVWGSVLLTKHVSTGMLSLINALAAKTHTQEEDRRGCRPSFWSQLVCKLANGGVGGGILTGATSTAQEGVRATTSQAFDGARADIAAHRGRHTEARVLSHSISVVR